MKRPSAPARVVRGLFYVAVAVALGAAPARAQVSAWDPGVPKDLLKDGQTDDKKPKPTRRVAPVPPECAECQPAANKLQAALDDWYALQFANAMEMIAQAQSGAKTPVTEKQAREQKEDALVGLGQKQRPPPKDKKKADLKKEVQQATKALQDCLAKCKEKGAPPATGESSPGVTQPEPAGGAGQATEPPPKNCIPPIPKLPDCFRSAAERDAYRSKLQQIQKKVIECRKIYSDKGAGLPAGDPQYNAWQQFKADVQNALDEINKQNFPDDKGNDAIDKVQDCPKTGSMGPRKAREEFCALIRENKIKVEFIGTGETSGHIADAKIANLTDGRLSCTIPPMVLVSISGNTQDYACPRPKRLDLPPKQTKTVPLEGVCLVRNKEPVPKNVSGDLKIARCDGDSRITEQDEDDFLRITDSVFEAADKLLKEGKLNEIPYKDPDKKKEIVVQWVTWSNPDISRITDVPPAKKEDLKEVVYKQIPGPIDEEKAKKIDEGIDKIFETVELTSKRAKDLERPRAPSEDADATEKEDAGPDTSPVEEIDQPGSDLATRDKPKKDKQEQGDEMLDDFQRWWKNFKKNVPKPFQDWAYKKGVAQAAEQRKKDAAGQYDKARQQHFDANKHYRDVKQQRDLAERKAKAAGATPQDKEVFDKADKELKKLEADLKKEFNETKAGQDAAKALHAAEKETAKAQKEADAAGKNLDPETKKFIEEQMKGDPPPTYWVPPS